MMPVIKHFDPVMGVDIHIVVLPPGVPTPMPHPHIAMIIDPMDYVPVMGATVFIGPLPRASAGTAGKVIPHIPMGGPFVKPPMNEDEIFMGSAMVLADGDPLSFTALPVLSCQDVGMISPPRKKPKRSYGMVLPTSIVMGIPLGMPVLVGGPPTINMMALGMSAVMKALGPAIKKLRALQKKSARIKKISDAIHKRASKAMDKLGVPPNIRNKVHKSICTVTGHPVDVASGKLFTDAVDFELPGPIPLAWERTWYSTSVYSGPLGSGWHHNYDLALIEGEKALALRLADGRPVAFPLLQPGEISFDRAERLTLIRDSHGYALDTLEGLRYRFALIDAQEKLHLLKAVTHKANGAQIRLEYDGQRRLRQIIDSGGRFIRLEYTNAGLLQKIFLPQPGARTAEEWYCAVEYHYQDNMLIGVDDALKQRMSYQYSHGLLVKETYRNGFSFYFRFDGQDQNARCTETWGDGNLYRRLIRYDPTNNITDVEDSLGHTTRYYHDGVLPHRIVDPLNSISTVEYNEYSQIICETNELGYKTLYEYDDFGNNTKITNPDGAATTMTYDQNHNMVAMEDVVGGKWQYRYNGQDRLIEEIDPLGNRTTYFYNDVALTSVTNAKGNRYFLEYDQNLNVCRIAEEKGISIETRYDVLGNITEMTDTYGNKRTFAHDRLGRIVQINEPDGNVRRMEYDADDNITDMRDHYSHIQMRYQAMGTLVSRSQQGATVSFTYDTEQQLRAIINEHGTAYEFELDPMGEIVRESGFDGLIRHYYRDAAGQARRVRRPGGRFTEYAYDAMGRVTEIRYSDGDRESYEYRADGELTKAVNRAISVKFVRDVLGRVLKESQGDHWIASEMDELGYRIKMKSSLGLQQLIERDIRGDVARITVGEEVKFVTEFQRDAAGTELQRVMPGGLRSRWQRDKLGRPIKHEVTAAKQVYRSHSYIWGVDDRLQSVVDILGRETLFRYDALGTLTAAKYGNGAFELRVPDAIGNLFRTEAQNDREYGPGGKLLAVHEKNGTIRYEYDAEGNLISKRTADDQLWRYDWNDAGNLRRVVRPDGKKVLFEYDPFGRRISKSANGKITRWVWDGNNPVHEWIETLHAVPASNTPVHQAAIAASQRAIVLQPQQAQAPPAVTTWLFDPEDFSPLAKMVGGEYFPVVSDFVGAAVGMFDPQGARVWSMELDAWGRPRETQGNPELCPWRWPGQYEDAETGLYYNRFRYYDPDAGQYMSQDPIGLLGGLHLYSYVEDPLTWSDPWGLAKQKCGGAGTQRWKNKKTKSGRPYKKPGPKTNPNAPHNKKIRQIIRQEKAKGKIHIGGGSKTEIVLQTPGGKKPYRRMDASFRDPKTGKIEHHNVGKSNRGRGDPIARERDAISDVENHAPPKDRDITFHSYGTS